jgi:hypothetical protein
MKKSSGIMRQHWSSVITPASGSQPEFLEALAGIMIWIFA